MQTKNTICHSGETAERHGVWFPNTNTTESRRQLQMESYNSSLTSKALPNETLAKLHEAIVHWIVKDCRPLSITGDAGFVSMMKLATGCEAYIPPCCSTITAQMHLMYGFQRRLLVDRLIRAASVSLTADFWTSSQNLSYIGVTAHFIEDWTFQSVVLDVLQVSESHTAEVCGKALANIARDWSISDKVLCIVTDRNRSVVEGVEEHTPFVNSNCMAHVLRRAIAAGLTASSMDTLLAKCRKFVGHLKPSPTKQITLLCEATEALHLRHLSLIEDVTTRWFAGLAIAQRVLSHKELLNDSLDDAGETQLKLSDGDFATLEQLVELFAPLKAISDFLGSDEYATGSCTIHVVRKLELVLKPAADDARCVQQFKQALLSYMDTQIRIPLLLKTCASVDPRFKKLKGLNDIDKEQVYECLLDGMACCLISENDETANGLFASQRKVSSSILDSDTDTDQEDTDANGENNDVQLQAELLLYRSTKVEPMSTDPLAYWKKHAGTFPHVAQQAERLLCVPATSVPCERLFSVTGILEDTKRTALHPEHLRQILCLNSWLK